jgi:hypothetical protein
MDQKRLTLIIVVVQTIALIALIRTYHGSCVSSL